MFVQQTPYAAGRTFRVWQFVCASLYSLGHGGNAAHKTIGLIALMMYSQGHPGPKFHVPFRVVLASGAAISLGTLLALGVSCGQTR